MRADPYQDLEVIDSKAPRFNQLIVGLVSLSAALFSLWWLAALMALQLWIGLIMGRKWCLPCRFYFEVIQPKTGEGELEDSRPPRFANCLGASFLTVASFSFFPAPGFSQILCGLVALLALVASSTGWCLGCKIYLLYYRLLGKPVDCKTCLIKYQNS